MVDLFSNTIKILYTINEIGQAIKLVVLYPVPMVRIYSSLLELCLDIAEIHLFASFEFAQKRVK